MTRIALHTAAVATVITRLKRRGFTVERTKRTSLHRNPGELVVNGLSVAVLVARPHQHRHRVVYTQFNGTVKVYEYVKAVWHWNKHQHGKQRRGVDCWIYVAVNGETLVFPVRTGIHEAKALRVEVRYLKQHWLWSCRNDWSALTAAKTRAA